jgi:hypothetical protein
MSKSIEIVISPIGEVQIDAVGFKGADCEKATKFLEEALGIICQKQKKPEYHQRNVSQHQQKLGQ